MSSVVTRVASLCVMSAGRRGQDQVWAPETWSLITLWTVPPPLDYLYNTYRGQWAPPPWPRCSGVWLRVTRCDHLPGHIMPPPPGQVSPQWTPGLPSPNPLGQLSPWDSDAFYQRLSPTRDPETWNSFQWGVENQEGCWSGELEIQDISSTALQFSCQVPNECRELSTHRPWFAISWETAFITRGRGRDVARPDLISATQEGRLVIKWHWLCFPWPGPPWSSPHDNT